MTYVAVDRIQSEAEKMTIAKGLLVLSAVAVLHSAVAEGKTKQGQGEFHYLCPTDEDPNDPTHLLYAGDCTKFIKCSYGKAYTLSCPRGQHWSVALDRCEAVAVAKCDSTATLPPPVIGGGDCQFSYKAHESDCRKFYTCVTGIVTPLECIDGMHWDANENKCKWGACS